MPESVLEEAVPGAVAGSGAPNTTQLTPGGIEEILSLAKPGRKIGKTYVLQVPRLPPKNDY